MIKEENKELLFKTILACLLLLAVLILGIYFVFSIKSKNKDINESKPSSPPQIKEDYNYVILNNYKIYDNKVSVDENNEIILYSDDENISHYVIGKYGSIFSSMFPIYIINERAKYKDYEVIHNDEYYYYVDTKNNIISEHYDNIFPIKRYNEYTHLILENDKQFYILTLDNDEIKELDSNITNIVYVNEFDNDYINNNYLIVSNQDNKYGLIDYQGNIIINFKYDYLKTYITENKFIAKIDNKYGIINDKQEVIIDFDNDNIIFYKDLNNYSIFIKNKKIGIYYEDKLIINYKLDYSFTNADALKYIVNNDNLYLTLFSNNYDEIYNYIIDKNGIQTTSKKYYEPLYNQNNELKFFYTIDEVNNESKITYYDLDYNNLYTIEVPYKNTNNNFVMIELINDNISSIKYTIANNEIYYIDLFNSKQIKEMDALHEYFNNGYSFTLNDNRELKIYKNQELIGTFKDIDKYLGDYYFLSINYNEEKDIYNSIIYNIEFKKEN
ncbi:MAG: WG repeat-containing protein [bacterium]|nr:WG repeat-containing protein [bacterium]